MARIYAERSTTRIVLGVLICFGAAACGPGQKASGPKAPPNDRVAKLTEENRELQTTLDSKNEEILTLEKDIADLNMRILEYEAMIGDLQKRSEGHQRRLDAAIIEVVRTKARLRSLESKAEAASTIAEAEISVNALLKQLDSADGIMKEEISMAEHLLKMSVREFNARNFGGALYLANQSKSQARSVQMRLKGEAEIPLIGDEKQFVQPLPLVVLTNSNLRSGPGLDNAVLRTLAKGARVTGHSYLGRWVRVETNKGVFGWLFRPLVSPR